MFIPPLEGELAPILLEFLSVLTACVGFPLKRAFFACTCPGASATTSLRRDVSVLSVQLIEYSGLTSYFHLFSESLAISDE